MTKVLLITLTLLLTSCSYSEGERSGQVVKFSRKGFIFKTFEGELATLAKGQVGTMMSNTFYFTVDNDTIINKIRKAMQDNKRVNLTYEESFFVFPWEGDTVYFIKEVTILD